MVQQYFARYKVDINMTSITLHFHLKNRDKLHKFTDMLDNFALQSWYSYY